jgi:uncharacterized protein DUF6152
MKQYLARGAARAGRGLAVWFALAGMIGLMPRAAVERVVVPVFAHHSFGVAFDVTKPVTTTGVITAIEWMNPHSHVFMDVKEKSGKIAKWKFEGYPPNVLSRTGWKKDVTIKVGDTITVFGWRARDGSNFAHLREVTLSDGKHLYFGPPAGTGEGGAVAK